MNAADIKKALEPYGATLTDSGFISRNGKVSGVKAVIKGKRLRFELENGTLLASGSAADKFVSSFVEKFWFWTKTMKNPRRAPAKRPRLTPAAIARAHRNPDIHIDIGSHNATRAKGARTNPKRRAPSLPNRGYYILQLDPDIGKHGGLKFGLDHVTPVSWRIWRTSRVLPGYTFKLPESLYSKPAFIEWARKNSGPGFPLYASFAQAKAMVKALL